MRTLIASVLVLLAMQVPAMAQYRTEGDARRADAERTQQEYARQREREDQQRQERNREREREQQRMEDRQREAAREATRQQEQYERSRSRY